MKDSLYGDLSVIGMKGCEQFVSQVDAYLKEWRRHSDEVSFIVDVNCPRFGTGEAKGTISKSLRGHDVYIVCDPFNYGVTYKMYGKEVPMSPDDHFADLKRIISANAGKARRVSVIMPMLYEGRQHKRSSRESLDCAMALKELENLGVTITEVDRAQFQLLYEAFCWQCRMQSHRGHTPREMSAMNIPTDLSYEEIMMATMEESFQTTTEKVGRNSPCPCGSGK